MGAHTLWDPGNVSHQQLAVTEDIRGRVTEGKRTFLSLIIPSEGEPSEETD